MSDPVYKNVNFIFKSAGINARNVTDAIPPGQFLNLDNAEELSEDSMSTRLGSILINRSGTSVNPLPGVVHSLAKLASIGGENYRYAGSGSDLYRRNSLTQGPYSEVASGLSGSPWTAAVMQPNSNFTALPFIFIADSDVMLKDNGTLTPQQNGIFQPQFPIVAAIQNPPVLVELDDYTTAASGYTYDGISGGTNESYVSTTLLINVTGGQTFIAEVNDLSQIGPFQLLTINAGGATEETVLVMATGQQTLGTGDVPTTATFTAYFRLDHITGETVTSASLEIVVPASTTATVALSFGGKPIPDSETNVQNEADYVGLYIYVSDPTQVQSITLKLDCGDGSFNSDYFYKVIAQGPLQNLLDNVNDPTTAATDAILADSLNLYGNSPSSVSQLNTGQDIWTGILCQLSDFAGAGRAAFTDPYYNWANVNGYQVTVVTNDGASVTVQLAALVLFGGAGPDTFAGVPYDYLFTYFNPNDGTESNPSMVMSSVNPPQQTNWAYPRRMPVLLTLQLQYDNSGTYIPNLDPQATWVRIYRRGGTLGDNWRRIDEVPIVSFQNPQGTFMNYLDDLSDADIQQGDLVSLVNDVPVTSSLVTPINTTLATAIDIPPYLPGEFKDNIPSLLASVPANLSNHQQLSIGNISDPNYETVILFPDASGRLSAYVQNSHNVGEPVTAVATYGQPLNIIAAAYNQMWYAGDPNNPNYLYYSSPSYPQAVGSDNYVQVSTPDDPITAIVPFKGNLYVSTIKGWWAIAPGSNGTGAPTVYATAAKHGCIAPLGWCATEEGIFFQAVDGLRFFAGGASEYLSQSIEFIFQQVGSSPIVEANLNELSQTRMAYWNAMIFLSYVGVDGNRHRVILHTVYKRFRNDDQDAQSLILEPETNSLVFGDSNGLIYLDRQIQFTDEGGSGGNLVQIPIALNIQTPYTDVGEPSITKSFQELTLDILTNGQTLNVYLWFEDGEENFLIGTVNTSERSKVNFQLNSSNGFEYYKVSIQLTGNVSAAIYLYQASIKYLPLAKTRKTLDTFHLRFGTEDSKVAKDIFLEYTATADVTGSIYYDGSSVSGFTFTLPANGGVRNALRIRMPAVSFRLWRMILSCPTDFQVWENSRCQVKNLCVGRGYELMPFVPNG
jgi:hypothetical protein